MIYRIDLQHFITHAIDHFTSDDLVHFQYAIVSAKINNGRSVANTVKMNELYPSPEIVLEYDEYKDKNILEKMYFEMLDNGDIGKDESANLFYNVFVNTLINHYDVMILCDECENDYIDCLVKYLHKKFSIDVIDLNQLFTEGKTNEIYIDRKEIWNKAVDIRRLAGKEMIRTLSQTRDGRLKLLEKMSTKEKIEKCKEIGINVSKRDKHDLDSILIDEWVDIDDNE